MLRWQALFRRPAGARRGPGIALVLVCCLLLTLGAAPGIRAQMSDAQRAIEALEGCTSEERRQGCIRILKRETRADGLEAVKAQVRGGRIIWYEFDPRTGRVRRTN